MKMTVKDYRQLTSESHSRSKFGNKKTIYNDRVYDSKKEAEFAQQLDLRIRAGDIVKWEPQVDFPVVINGKKIGKYIADFRITYPNGRQEIVDVKGVKTDLYKWKKKLVEALYPINIIEV